MYNITTNSSGTRSISVAEEHLETIKRYSLFSSLIDSNGIIDEETLERLRCNIRGLLETEPGKDKRLLDLCLDVIYHQNMRALGLKNLHALYKKWLNEHLTTEDNSETKL